MGVENGMFRSEGSGFEDPGRLTGFHTYTFSRLGFIGWLDLSV